jgi:hypothetical protein
LSHPTCTPGVIAQGKNGAADAGEQLSRCLITIAFATGDVPRGDDHRIAGGMPGVLLLTGLPGGFGGMLSSWSGRSLFGGLFRSEMLRAAAHGREDGQSEDPNRDRYDSPDSAHGFHPFSFWFAFTPCSINGFPHLELARTRGAGVPERMRPYQIAWPA